MRLVAVATHDSGYFKWLKESCVKYGYTLDILGYGEKWLGFNWKLQKIIEYLENINDNEIICVIDAFDIIMLRDASELERNFKIVRERENCKMIIANELHNDIFSKLTGIWLFGLCKNENLNAGSYIAYAKDLKNILLDIQVLNNKKSADDQILLSNKCRKDPLDIYIDIKHELFLATVSDNELLYFNGIKIKNQELFYTNNDITTKPYLLHGVYNSNISEIIDKLGYYITDDEKIKLKKIHNISKFKKFFYYTLQPTNIILFIILILIFIYIYKKIKKN